MNNLHTNKINVKNIYLQPSKNVPRRNYNNLFLVSSANNSGKLEFTDINNYLHLSCISDIQLNWPIKKKQILHRDKNNKNKFVNKDLVDIKLIIDAPNHSISFYKNNQISGSQHLTINKNTLTIQGQLTNGNNTQIDDFIQTNHFKLNYTHIYQKDSFKKQIQTNHPNGIIHTQNVNIDKNKYSFFYLSVPLKELIAYIISFSGTTGIPLLNTFKKNDHLYIIMISNCCSLNPLIGSFEIAYNGIQ